MESSNRCLHINCSLWLCSLWYRNAGKGLLTTKMKLRWLPFSLTNASLWHRSEPSSPKRWTQRSLSGRRVSVSEWGRREKMYERTGSDVCRFFRSRSPRCDRNKHAKKWWARLSIVIPRPIFSSRRRNATRRMILEKWKDGRRIHTSYNIHSRSAGNDSQPRSVGFFARIREKIDMVDLYAPQALIQCVRIIIYNIFINQLYFLIEWTKYEFSTRFFEYLHLFYSVLILKISHGSSLLSIRSF